ncbi:MerR family transcriptional regulator [Nocardia sp. NPDC004722]
MEYTIDELARAADTTVRSVRVYHERGLLPSPDVRGRIGYYDADHFNRLQTISRLLSRGMKLNGIRELLDAWDRGEGLAEVLGVSDQSDTGGQMSPNPADLSADLPEPLRKALAESDDPLQSYRLINPRCGDLALRLVDAGLPVAQAIAMVERLRADCVQLADRYSPEMFHHLAGRAYEQSARSAKDRSAFETNLAIARLLITHAAAELFEQTLTRSAALAQQD